MPEEFHPDLMPVARFVPRSPVRAGSLSAIRRLTSVLGARRPRSVDGVVVCDVLVPGPEGAPPVGVRLYRPALNDAAVPAMLWIHGGGFVIGTAREDERNNVAIVRELGIAVASVEYRLAPEHPFPAPVEDCYAALRWLHSAAPAFGIRTDRLAVGGASAGGGLAAGVVLMAHDRNEVPVAFQLLVYPMLDDRTVLASPPDTDRLRLWGPPSNEFGWHSYLGSAPGGDDVDAYAAPARRVDLAGLPPTWIGVGTLDLFHSEDLAYAERLREAGVSCELVEVTGAYHGFDGISPRAEIVRRFRRSYLEALRTALHQG
jgi:acetyl esterase/lipase